MRLGRPCHYRFQRPKIQRSDSLSGGECIISVLGRRSLDQRRADNTSWKSSRLVRSQKLLEMPPILSTYGIGLSWSLFGTSFWARCLLS